MAKDHAGNLRMHKFCPLTQEDCRSDCAWQVGAYAFMADECAIAAISDGLRDLSDVSDSLSDVYAKLEAVMTNG